jgi:fumarate reductase (CoM/CoB) subunit B
MTDLRRATELCEFCPKMCRFACPVSEVTAREALTPWGKVSLAALAGRAPDTSAALAFAGCTGCLRCQTYCAHGNDVPAVLYAARATAVRAGSAPEPWAAVAKQMTAMGHAEAADLLAVHRRIAAEEGSGRSASRSHATPTSTSTPTSTATSTSPSTPGWAPTSPLRPLRAVAGAAAAWLRPPPDPVPLRPILFAGCDALAAGGVVVREALAVAGALDAPLALAPESALCCGLKLAEAGHVELFAAHAAQVRAALLGPGRRPGPIHAVFLAPGCARAVRERWPALPAGSRVEHVTTYLSRALSAHPDARERPPMPGAAAYHDPCELARGLSELTAPRALLAAAILELREPVRCGTDASCCGAAGLLPRTLPGVAAAIARDRASELDQCGAPAVTASPACAAALGAEDVVSVLARWLGVAVERSA